MKHSKEELVEFQSYPLDIKLMMTQDRIRGWYKNFGGDVYVSRSGGAWNETEHEQRLELRRDGVTNTLTNSRKDNLVIQEICPSVVGGIGEKKSNSGTQFYQQDRVYDGDKIATSLSASLPGGANMYSISVEYECDANTGTEPGIFLFMQFGIL